MPSGRSPRVVAICRYSFAAASPGTNAGTVLADVEIEQDADRFSGRLHRLSQLGNRERMVGGHREGHVGEAGDKFDGPADVRADRVIGQASRL